MFEFKLNGIREEALAQINRKQYAEKYLDTGKELVLVGVEFDAVKRNIGQWIIESC